MQHLGGILPKGLAGRFRNLENSELFAKMQIDVGMPGSAPCISSHVGGPVIHNVVMIFVLAGGNAEGYARAEAHDRAGLDTPRQPVELPQVDAVAPLKVCAAPFARQ